MGESGQLSIAPKISGEFLSFWVKFLQNSKFFGCKLDEIRPNRKKFSTARIRPFRARKIIKYLLCTRAGLAQLEMGHFYFVNAGFL
jgi:hypothetical protein